MASTTLHIGTGNGIYRVLAHGQNIGYESSEDKVFVIDNTGLLVTGFDRVVAGNRYAFIGPGPSIPNLNIQYGGSPGSATSFQIRLEVEDRIDRTATLRDSTTWFPSQSGYQSIPVTGSILLSAMLNGDYRGGKAILHYKLDTETTWSDYTFYIRGYNPLKSNVYAYVASLPDSLAPWFYKKMMTHESGSQIDTHLRQFNPDGNVSPDWTSTIATPNWGYPDGWGIMQIDLSSIGQHLPEQGLWSWQYNVRRGLWVLNGKLNNRVAPGASGRGARQFWEEQVAAYYDFCNANPGSAPPPPDNITYGASTFGYTPQTGQHSFRDAIWIKQYNGASGGNFISWVSNHWEIHSTNSSGINYVQIVCLTQE
jgi:hypothetical protein